MEEEKEDYEKTWTQRRIEALVTKERRYQTVPYTRFFGQRFALQQWLFFSYWRCVNLENSCFDETSFWDYLPALWKYFEGKVREETDETFSFMKEVEREKYLKKRTKSILLSS